MSVEEYGWVAHITSDFLTCYSCSYYGSMIGKKTNVRLQQLNMRSVNEPQASKRTKYPTNIYVVVLLLTYQSMCKTSKLAPDIAFFNSFLSNADLTFFICYQAAPRLTLGHCGGNSLTSSMLFFASLTLILTRRSRGVS